MPEGILNMRIEKPPLNLKVLNCIKISFGKELQIDSFFVTPDVNQI